MHSSAQFLTETFDHPYPWQWTHEDEDNIRDDEQIARFVVPELADVGSRGRRMDVNIESQGDGSRYVMFGPSGRAFAGKKFDLHALNNQTVASRILATVVDVLRAYMAEHPDVTHYEFDAKEPSRAKLYARMLARALPSLPRGPWRSAVATDEAGIATFTVTRQEMAK